MDDMDDQDIDNLAKKIIQGDLKQGLKAPQNGE